MLSICLSFIFPGLSFPAEGSDASYKNSVKDVITMLRTKHADNYLVLNLSERRYDMAKLNSQENQVRNDVSSGSMILLKITLE